MNPQVGALSSYAIGNLLSAFALAAGTSKNVGVAFNNATAGLSGANYPFSWDVCAQSATGASVSSTTGISASLYNVLGTTTTTGTTTNNGTNVSAGGTSVTVASASGITVGMKIGLDSGTTGELVTVSAISGNTLTISATLYAHVNGCNVYVIPQTAPVVFPNLGVGGAANSTYSSSLLNLDGNRDWYLSVYNLDATYVTTVTVTARPTTGVQ